MATSLGLAGAMVLILANAFVAPDHTMNPNAGRVTRPHAPSLYQANVASAKTAAATRCGSGPAGCATPRLEVFSALTSSAANGPKSGDQVGKFNWLLNLDNTGNSTKGSDVPSSQPYAQNCHPIQSNPDGSPKVDNTRRPVLNGYYPDGLSAGGASVNVARVAQAPLYGNSEYLGGGTFRLPDPATAACPWPALHYETASPVISEGDQSNWNTNLALPGFDGTRGLPPGKYLVSVTADGYEIGGAHFTICPTADDPVNCPPPAPLTSPQPQRAPALVTVGLNPYPLPLGTVKARAFADISPTSGAYQPTDPPLAGFTIHLADFNAEVSADYYGNLLCTEYQTVDGKPGSAIKLDAKGTPTPKSPAQYTDGVVPGHCMTGPDGIVTVPNMPPGRYGVSLVAPQAQQANTWIQNTTLEGNHDFDVWLMPAATGLDTEQVIAGEPQPFANFGYVPVANALPAGTLGGGVTVAYTATSLTDTSASWTANQWAGDSVTSGLESAVIASNTAATATSPATLTLTGAGWTPALKSDSGIPMGPPNGQAYSIHHHGGALPTGEVKGQIMGSNNYVPGLNGIPGAGGNSGFSGIKLDRPVKGGWVALSNMNQGTDGRMVFAGPSAPDGRFDITNVPDGDYSVTVWDQPQDYALDQFTITVAQGQSVDVGVLPLLNWFTRVSGTVFVDLNGNGRRDPGEPGVPKFLIQNLNRTNNTYEQGQQTSTTNDKGYYEITEGYPLGQFNVEQYFNTRYKTTGVTYQSCNDTQEHTVISPFVDISYAPIIGQCGHVDIGVQPYDPSHSDNGGIVATVLYDDIRTATAARQEPQFSHMTGIPQVTTDLYNAVTGAPGVKNSDGSFTDGKGFLHNKDGSYHTAQASPLNGDAVAGPAQRYVTENYGPPTGCVPLDANGKVVDNTQQDAIGVPGSMPGYNPRCTESSLTGVGIGGGTDNAQVFPGAQCDLAAGRTGGCHGVQTVDGNYTLDATDSTLCPTDAAGQPVYSQTPGCFRNQLGDFVVHITSPTDNVLPGNHPLFTASKEEDVNTFSGDQWVPQGADTRQVAWPPHADPARQMPTGPYPENPGTSSPGPDAQCAGPNHLVHVTNADFLAAGGSPFEGQQRNLCDSKLFHVQPGQSVAPNFHVHTLNDVPIPGKFSGYIVDDVSASTDRKSTNLGEVAGIAGAPIGFYDWAGNVQFTATSDYDGQFEALMPSTQISNCLSPAGVCPNVYRLVGNDPGQWPAPNSNYNPSFKTIAAEFQNWPGQFLAADVAPSKQIVNLEAAGAQFAYPPACNPAVTAPQVFAVDRPYRRQNEGGPGNSVTLTISGQGFAQPSTAAPSATLTLGTTSLTLKANPGWTDSRFSVTVPPPDARRFPAGAYQLTVTNGSKLTTPQGLTYHVLGAGYSPTVLAVGPTKGPNDATANLNLVPANQRFTSIQAALEYAAGFDFPAFLSQVATGGDPTYPLLRQGPVSQALVIVYPADPLTSSPGGAPSTFTPFGTYYENLIVHSPAKIQGVGPGGSRSDGTAVQGTRVDGAYFWSTSTAPDLNGDEAGGNLSEFAGSNEPYAAAWLTLAEAISDVGGEAAGWDGNSNIIEGQVVYVVAKKGSFTSGYPASMDGFRVSGGDQKDFPGNVNEAFGTHSTALQEFGNTDELPGVLQTQGGGFFLNAYADNFRITNDLIQGNSGSYGGAIRVGTPYVNAGTVEDGKDQTNTNVLIANNRIIANGGTNLAGAIGLFSGSNGYRISQNVLCGNYSLEYGGAISHFGQSGNPASPGRIDHNKIFLNGAAGEGGGIMVAGELVLPAGLPAGGGTPFGGGLSPGAGPVVIASNRIASNLADDDGGGIRFLAAGTAPMSVVDNLITNNVSSHEGGGIAIDDTPYISIANDTIVRNITTATATTSDGAPAPAGISTTRNSDLLQRTLPSASPVYSNPKIDHSIIWGNLAGSWASGGVAGIGLVGDTTPVNIWDVGTVDQSGLLSPTNSVLDAPLNAVEGCNGCGAGNPNPQGNYITPPSANPNFPGAFLTQIDVLQIRTYFRFRPSAIVSITVPGDAFGNYSTTNYNGIGSSLPGGQ